MGTFLEFYMSLIKFVNFKLQSDCKVNFKDLDLFDEQGNIKSQKFLPLQKKVRSMFSKDEQQPFQVSEEFKETPEMKEISKKMEQQQRQRNLYKNFKFFLNREAPIYSLQFLILSFGGDFTLDNLDDKSVTHHVLDRPLTEAQKQEFKKKNRELVQPQWVVDSLNATHILPTKAYFPGVAPPPHMSPFVDDKKEGYMPERAREILRLKGEELSEDEDMEPQVPVNKETEKEKEVIADSSSDDESDLEDVPEDKYVSSEEEEAAPKGKTRKQAKEAREAKLKKDLDTEQKEMGKMLMTKKERRIFSKVEHSQAAKKAQATKLKQKKQKL